MPSSLWDQIESLCGSEEKLWDHEKFTSPNSTVPEFSRCFQHTILSWFPCIFLVLSTPLLLYQGFQGRKQQLPLRKLILAKLVFSGFTMVCMMTRLVTLLSAHKVAAAESPVVLTSSLVLCFSMLLLLLLVMFCQRMGVITSASIFLSLLVHTLFGIVEFSEHLEILTEKGNSDASIFASLCFVGYFFGIVVSLFLQSIPDKLNSKSQYTLSSGERRSCPESSSSFIDRATFGYFTPFLYNGWKKPLLEGDVWELTNRDTSTELIPKWSTNWKPVITSYFSHKAQALSAYSCSTNSKNGISDDHRSLTQKIGQTNREIAENSGKIPRLPSIVWCLMKCLKWKIVVAILMDFTHMSLTFANPQLLRQLIRSVQDASIPSWQGYTFAALLLVCTTLYTIFLNGFWHHALRMGMNVKTMLTAAIFDKALKLSNSARKDLTVGEITNLMAVDAQRMLQATPWLRSCYSVIYMVGLSLYFLYKTVGNSAFVGLALMLATVPANLYVCSLQNKVQGKQMKEKDKRVKLMNEILNGMKILKLYAWEPAMEERISNIRNQELKYLRRSLFLDISGAIILTSLPLLVAAGTLGTYVLSDPANILTPEVAFVSLSLLNIMRIPLMDLPWGTTFVIQAIVANKRLKQFLSADELDPNTVSHEKNENYPVIVDNATFTWNRALNIPTLQNVNFRVRKGSLLAVVGEVGSGKSSLISALLGEMEKLQAKTCNVHGSVAYVPQQAWLQNATLKNNILFGKVAEEGFYNCVLDGCALRRDLQILPGGDQIEIGEKGINLSGGQKQRISLARAVYQDSDVYFLDDPLSAVDPHVGKHIFDQVIGKNGMLREKYVDSIVVMKNGRISETGTFEQLLQQRGAFAEYLASYLMALGQKPKGTDDEKSD